MTPPIRMVSVPVELLPCPFCGKAIHIRKGVNSYGHCKTEGCHANRAQIVPLDDQKQVAAWNRRALTAAPVREEGGAEKEAFRALDIADRIIQREMGLDVPEEWGAAYRAVADARAKTALATREEAPAEAGDEEDMAKALAKADGENPDAVWFEVVGQEPPKMWARYLPLARVALRAQPQAREEAQPVAWQWRAVDEMGPRTSWRLLDQRTEREMRDWASACSVERRALYATPPAPEAEKLRVALEEARDAIRFFDQVKTASEGEQIAVGRDHWDRVEAALRALAALQQEGR